MILKALIPYFVFACSILAAIAGACILVLPWKWRWGIPISLFISVLALGILVISGATALDVAHYLGWLG